jgi:hypothetical protein
MSILCKYSNSISDKKYPQVLDTIKRRRKHTLPSFHDINDSEGADQVLFIVLKTIPDPGLRPRKPVIPRLHSFAFSRFREKKLY